MRLAGSFMFLLFSLLPYPAHGLDTDSEAWSEQAAKIQKEINRVHLG